MEPAIGRVGGACAHARSRQLRADVRGQSRMGAQGRARAMRGRRWQSEGRA